MNPIIVLAATPSHCGPTSHSRVIWGCGELAPFLVLAVDGRYVRVSSSNHPLKQRGPYKLMWDLRSVYTTRNLSLIHI